MRIVRAINGAPRVGVAPPRCGRNSNSCPRKRGFDSEITHSVNVHVLYMPATGNYICSNPLHHFSGASLELICMRRFPRLIVGTVAASTLAAVSLSFAAFAAPASRIAISGSVPPWAASVSFASAADTSASVAFRIYLGWSDSAGAEALARAVSTPGNPRYRHFLTPAQFRQQFAPTQSDVTAVQQWLRNSGFTVDYTPTNNHYVAAEGTRDCPWSHRNQR
jgi:hypothetical protein